MIDAGSKKITVLNREVVEWLNLLIFSFFFFSFLVAPVFVLGCAGSPGEDFLVFCVAVGSRTGSLGYVFCACKGSKERGHSLVCVHR